MRLKQTLRSIWLPVITVVLAVGCSRSPQAEEAKYLERGKKELQQNNYVVAILHFRNAAQAMPKDAEPYYQLGLTYLGTKDVRAAAAYFRKASELNPKHMGAQLKLAELMFLAGSQEIVAEVEKRARNVLNVLPDDTEALNLLAVTELRLGKPESAEEHLEQALRKSPGHLASSVMLAKTRLARHDVKGAEDALQGAIGQAPKSPDPFVYLGGFYLTQGRTTEAEQKFRQALQLDPKNGSALIALGAMQVRAGQHLQAEQTYRQLSTLSQKRYKPAYALFLFQSGKRDEAVAELAKLSKADPADRDLRTLLVRACLGLKRMGQAEKILADALERNPHDADALLQRSRMYLGSARYTEAQADLNQVLRYRKESAEAHYLLSKLHQGRGETASRQRELGEALLLQPEFVSARIELAQVLTAAKSAQAALDLINETPKEQKKTVPVMLQKNWIFLALGQKSAARQGIDNVLALGRIPDALLQDAALKLDQKDYAGARACAEEILTQNPEDKRALLVLVDSYAGQKQMPAGLQRVREYASQQPKSAPLQAFLGQLLLAGGNPREARQAFEAARSNSPGWVDVELALSQLDISEGKLETARKTLSALVSAHPESVAGRLLWAEVEARDNRPAVAVEQYRKLLERDPGNVTALNNLAYLLADNNQADEALKYAQQAKELAPDSPAVDDTLGWTYFRKGIYTLAVSHLERAAGQEGTARRKYHLGLAYMKAGDQKRGQQVLEAALKMDPQLSETKAAHEIHGRSAK